MIIVPIVMGPGAVGGRTLPKLSRLDFPNLKPGDAVGVLRHDGDWLLGWGVYLFVVPTEEEGFWPHVDGTRTERYWSFHEVTHRTTKWGAKRALRKLVRVYRDGQKHEITEYRL